MPKSKYPNFQSTNKSQIHKTIEKRRKEMIGLKAGHVDML